MYKFSLFGAFTMLSTLFLKGVRFMDNQHRYHDISRYPSFDSMYTNHWTFQTKEEFDKWFYE